MTARDEITAQARAEFQLGPEDRVETRPVRHPGQKFPCEHSMHSSWDECSDISVKLVKSEDFIETI